MCMSRDGTGIGASIPMPEWIFSLNVVLRRLQGLQQDLCLTNPVHASISAMRQPAIYEARLRTRVASNFQLP